jgi:hypothetical protein
MISQSLQSDKWNSSWRYIFTIEQVFSMTTVWTWDGRRGDKLRVVRLYLRMLWMPPVADKSNGITITLYYCYYYHLHCT